MTSYRYLIYTLDTAYLPPRLANARPWWTDPSSDPSYSLATVVVDLLENRCFWQGQWTPAAAEDAAEAVLRVSQSTIDEILRERDQAIARMHTAQHMLGQCEAWRGQDARTIASLRSEVAQLRNELAALSGAAEAAGRRPAPDPEA
ncbi:MAG TPA: hypothetical protein VD886_04440 [Herpetosiphonaceae bacterium]|nr:hypothetical protein [Herpetosiphonaceae bacterium]